MFTNGLRIVALGAVAALAACTEQVSPRFSVGVASLTVVSGDGQTGPTGQELPQPLVVKVVGSNGKGISGQLVNFRVTAGGGQMFAGSSVTDAKGQAQDYWTLGQTRGAQRVDVVAVDPTTGAKLNFGSFSATALAPAALSFTPSSADFTPAFVDVTTSAQSFTLTNTGDQASGVPAITIGGSNPGDFHVTTNNCTNALAGGAACTVSVAMTPQAVGQRSASLNAAGSPGGSASSAMSGTAVASGTLQVSPLSFDFGSIGIAQGSQQTFVVQDTSVYAATTVTVTVSGSNAADFLVTSNSCGFLTGRSSCSVTVTFSPSATGARSATLNISALAANPVSASLSGTGVTPPNLSISPASHDFGTQPLSTTSVAQVFTVTNSGQATSGVLSVSISGTDAGDFAVQSTTCDGMSLGGGQSCTVSVTFTPSGSGARSASLAVDLGKPGTGPTAALTGSGS